VAFYLTQSNLGELWKITNFYTNFINGLNII